MKLILCLTAVFYLTVLGNSQKNFAKEADNAFMNESFYSAIELYKKAEVKEKKPAEKARINFQIAECYRMMVEPAQAQTFYKRSVMLKYDKEHPELYIYLADVLKEQGDYKSAEENYNNFLAIDPNSVLAKEGAESCKKAIEWTDEPTKHFIQNEIQINTDHYDYSSAWGDKKHETIIFSSSREGSTGEAVDMRTGESYMDLWSSTRDNKGKWGEPMPLPLTINTEDNEGASVLNKKGDQMFFTRCPREKKTNIGCDIFTAKKQGDGWKKAELLVLKPDGADSLSCGHPTIDMTGTLMIFASDLPGGFGGKDLWYTEFNKRDKVWGEPTNLGATINTSGDEMFPHLTDKKVLYFSSTGHPGMGGLDIFKAENSGDKVWENIENLRYPLNSAEHDFGIIFERGSDERRGFFTSNRDGGKGKDDLYSFNLPDILFSLVVYVTNKEDNEPVAGVTVSLKGDDGSEVVRTTDAEGKLVFEEEGKKRFILKETSYNLEVSKDEYLAATNTISTKGEEKSKRFLEEVFLQPVVNEVGEAIVIDFPEVQYAYDQWDLLVDERINSQDSLDYLFNTLTQNPNIVIELQAHTDCRGSSRYNKDLSQKRAQSCVDYLISKGIPADRMVPVGYGESTPRADGLECKSIDKMGTKEEQEAAHQRNRRTQFRVLSSDYKAPEQD
ncbi:MAG: OmpA family protein [Flavobacteriales bacterium]|nr:OmpA family protein [Flavobacteriales bacterium]